MTNKKINLPTVSHVGGYVINYIFDGHVLVCGDCANKIVNHDDYDVFIADEKSHVQYIHWEGDSSYCENCDKEIESEYGSDDE